MPRESIPPAPQRLLPVSASGIRNTLSDCRNEAMTLRSSSTSEISNCVRLLQNTMDPPNKNFVKQAVQYLKGIGACRETGSQRSKLVATQLGVLMAYMPFNIADSRAILNAAQHGYVYEMLLLQSVLSIKPPPIVNSFADEQKTLEALRKYSINVDPKDNISVALAHMSAYMF
jgi:HrpA-like RNA helicase